MNYQKSLIFALLLAICLMGGGVAAAFVYLPAGLAPQQPADGAEADADGAPSEAEPEPDWQQVPPDSALLAEPEPDDLEPAEEPVWSWQELTEQRASYETRGREQLERELASLEIVAAFAFGFASELAEEEETDEPEDAEPYEAAAAEEDGEDEAAADGAEEPELLLLRVTLSEGYGWQDIAQIFDSVEWAVAHYAGPLWGSRVYEPAEALLQIFDAEEQLLYQLHGRASQAEREDDFLSIYGYYWQAELWPEDTDPYDFIAYDHLSQSYAHEYCFELVEGLAVYDVRDHYAIIDTLGFDRYASQDLVQHVWGDPRAIAAYNFGRYGITVEAVYAFGNVFFSGSTIRELSITQPGYAGPRGIAVGDAVELLFERFPAREDWREAALTVNFPGYGLYQVGEFCGAAELDDAGDITRVTYYTGGPCLSFDIANGAITRICYSLVSHGY